MIFLKLYSLIYWKIYQYCYNSPKAQRVERLDAFVDKKWEFINRKYTQSIILIYQFFLIRVCLISFRNKSKKIQFFINLLFILLIFLLRSAKLFFLNFFRPTTFDLRVFQTSQWVSQVSRYQEYIGECVCQFCTLKRTYIELILNSIVQI